jgi:hypothetical protein
MIGDLAAIKCKTRPENFFSTGSRITACDGDSDGKHGDEMETVVEY